MRKTFTFKDFIHACHIEENTYQLKHKSGVRPLGAKIIVPKELLGTYPYNASAYDFLQFFRQEIYEYGIIEIPELPLNLSNYTVAMRAPEEHQYSSNPYLSESCQSPHQDTPPYPTAFWLGKERLLSATWIMTDLAAEQFFEALHKSPQQSIETIHRAIVSKTLKNQSALLLNHRPGLLLIDNSSHHQLYHAKTCRFENRKAMPNQQQDNPMYSFNEVGLMHYIDTLDEQRGTEHRDEEERAWVRQFMG